MKVSWIFLIVLSASVSTSLDAGDGVGNGEGIAEKNTIAAFLSLPQAIELCLKSEACQITQDERALLVQINSTLPYEGKAEKLIEFVSEQKAPGFFMIDGELKIAKTGSHVGSTIFINIDLLYPKDRSSLPTPRSVAGMTAILIHELGHHHGIKDHRVLDVLGSKVENLLLSQSQEIRGGALWRNVTVTTIDFGKDRDFTRVILNDGENYYDLTQAIADAVTCDPLITNSKPIGIRIWNLAWTGGFLIQSQYLKARVEQVCESVDNTPIKIHGYSVVEIHPQLTPGPKGIRISERIHATEVKCSARPAACW